MRQLIFITLKTEGSRSLLFIIKHRAGRNILRQHHADWNRHDRLLSEVFKWILFWVALRARLNYQSEKKLLTNFPAPSFLWPKWALKRKHLINIAQGGNEGDPDANKLSEASFFSFFQAGCGDVNLCQWPGWVGWLSSKSPYNAVCLGSACQFSCLQDVAGRCVAEWREGEAAVSALCIHH